MYVPLISLCTCPPQPCVCMSGLASCLSRLCSCPALLKRSAIASVLCTLFNRHALRTLDSLCTVHNVFCATSEFLAVFFDISQNNLQLRGAINYQYTMCTIHNTQSIDLYESPHENDATTTFLSSLIHTFELIDLVFQRNRDLFCAKRVYDKTKRARQVRAGSLIGLVRVEG